MIDRYDFAVIGGGSAGYAAARTAAALGLRTVVIDGAEELGGLCILRGCMPSKTLIESANRMLVLQRAKEFGLRAEAIAAKPHEIIARKRRLIAEFAEYRADQLEHGDFDLVRGTARFVSSSRVEVTLRDHSQSSLEAKAFLVATGSRIHWPDVPGLKDCLTSDNVLDLETLPESIAVLGGGAVALEMAHYFAAMGTRVELVQRSSHILKDMDSEVSGALRSALEHRMRIWTDTQIERIETGPTGSRVVFNQGGECRTLEVSQVLNAMGRVANTAALGLESIGVKMRGVCVETAPDQQTNVAGIYAAGDVCGMEEIVHVAIAQGELAARNVARALGKFGKLGGAREAMDYRLRLFGIFTEPQVAVAGMTEREALAQGIAIRTASYPFADHGKSMVMGELEGFVKLIADTQSGELLGGAVVGPHASELIHEVIVAMRYRATAAEFAAIPHYHPTLSEIWTYPAEELAAAPSASEH